jgi:hypothetical protein
LGGLLHSRAGGGILPALLFKKAGIMPYPYVTTPRGLYGLGDGGAAQAQASAVQSATQDYLNARAQLSQNLWQYGEPFWLPVALGLGTTPAAGLQFTAVTTAVDFDLLIVAAHVDLKLSSLEIRDTARNRLLTNGPTLASALATFTTSSLTMDRSLWVNGFYLLPARAQLAIITTADGTESGGRLTFLCKQPPVTTP